MIYLSLELIFSMKIILTVQNGVKRSFSANQIVIWLLLKILSLDDLIFLLAQTTSFSYSKFVFKSNSSRALDCSETKSKIGNIYYRVELSIVIHSVCYI
jgi:hypothetical protein